MGVDEPPTFLSIVRIVRKSQVPFNTYLFDIFINWPESKRLVLRPSDQLELVVLCNIVNLPFTEGIWGSLTPSTPDEFFHYVSVSFESLDGFLRVVWGPHLERGLPSLGKAQYAMTKGQVTSPPDGIRGADSQRGLIVTFFIDRLLHIPYFDRLVQRARNNLVASFVRPVNAIDLSAMSLNLGDRK